ncbi:MAG: CapA family protein [Deltaproteobacteria bacterium]|nr:CapA family protein [Deltaproteobacteria bacterium]
MKIKRSFQKLGLCFLVFLLSACAVAESKKQTISQLSLLFVGDIMQHDPQIQAAYDPKTQTYSYDDSLKYVKSIFEATDVVIGNLELTFGGKPYKGYPQFSAPSELASGLKNAGVDYLVTANNHSCDRGKKGIEGTLEALDKAKIIHTGTFKNQKQREKQYPLIIEKNGIRLAVLNYTYGTNGLPIPEPNIVNLIDRDQIKKDLTLAKLKLPDKIIVFFHWGVEYQREPNQEQKDLAQFCLDEGADWVMGSHPHVLQKMEKFNHKGKEVLVVNSLGNFVSNQRDRYRDGAAMVKVVLEKVGGLAKIKQSGYYLTWVYDPYEEGRHRFYILPVAQYEKDKEFFGGELPFKFVQSIKDARELFLKQNKDIHEYIYNAEQIAWQLDK